MGRQNVADTIKLGFKCPKCGEQTEKPVSWFVGKDVMPCDGCGYGINLKDPHARRQIEEAARNVARVQAALTEASDKT